MTVLIVLLLAAVFAPLITAYGPNAINPLIPYQGPSVHHLFGTDEIGRDLFSRVVYGGRLTFTITFGATAVAVAVGSLWGATAAASPWWVVDEFLMRIGDINMAVPQILLALIIVAAAGSATWTLVLALGLIFAPGTARVVRAAVAVEMGKDYRLAAIAYGASRVRVLALEVSPNVLPTLLAQTSLVAAGVLLTEATLSFIGLGVQPPQASWGALLQVGYANSLQTYWYMAFPLGAIAVTVLALNTLGDHLQLLFDPSGSSRG